MTTPHPIRPHKGGRTARAPDARIRPQTLQRIHEAMCEQGKTFADLLEDQYSPGDDAMMSNYAIDYKAGGDDAKNHGWVPVYRDFPNRVKKYYSDKAEADTVARNVATALNVKTRVRTT